MDFASMKSVQMIEFVQQQFYSSFSEEISKPLNETISQLEREIEEKDRVIANLRKQLSQKQVSSTPKERLYDFKYDGIPAFSLYGWETKTEYASVAELEYAPG